MRSYRAVVRGAAIFTLTFLIQSCGEFLGFSSFPDPGIGDATKVQIYLSESALEKLYDSTFQDDFAHCVYEENGRRSDALIKVRGLTSRFAAKKSFTVKFESEVPTERYIFDSTWDNFVTNPLAFYVHREAGLPAPQTEGVGLFINDSYLGYYNRFLPYNEEQMESVYGDGGELFEAFFEDMGDDIPLKSRSDKKFPDDDDYSSLETLIRNAAQMSDQAWSDWVSQHVAWRDMAKYMAVHDFIELTDVDFTNFYLYNNDDGIRILPWDNENSFRFIDFTIGGDNLLNRRLLELPFVDLEYRTVYYELFITPGPLNILDKVKVEANRLYNFADTAVNNDPSRYVRYSDFLKEKTDVLFFLNNRPSQGPLPAPP